MDKGSIRERIISLRESMSKTEVETKSRIITSRILQCEEYIASRRIMLYNSFRNEVNTKELLLLSLQKGKTVCLPRVEKDKTITARLIDNINQLDKGVFGLMEPRAETTVISPKDIELVFVPGVAFDLKGNRIGFGAGYYDRFLKDFPNDRLTLGVCYSFQIIDNLPASPWDIPVKGIVTEEFLIRF